MSEMPNEWVLAAVEDLLASLDSGKTIDQGWSPKCEDFPSSDETTWGALKTTAIQDGWFEQEHTKQLPSALTPKPQLEVREGDLLMTCAGPRVRCGVVCQVEKVRRHLFISGKMYRFRADERVVSAKYLLGVLRSKELQQAIDAIKTGGSDSGLNLTQDRFKRLLVPIAPLPEQNRIVAKLDALNAKSARARTELACIETFVARYKEAVLRKAFSGKLTPRHGGKAEIQFTSEHTAKIDGRTPELSALAATWSWVALSSVAEVSGGLTKNSKRESLPLQVPYLRVANVYANELRLDDVSLIGCTENEVTRTTLMAGDLLLVEGNGSLDQIGRVALWGDELEQCVHQNHLIKVRPCVGLDSKFALYWLLSPLGRRAIEAVAASSSGLHTLSLSKVGGLPLPLCNLEEQHEIVRRIESAFAKIDRLEKEAKRALELVGRLDEAILAKAFRGELVAQDVNDEPVGNLLARTRAEREAASNGKRGRGAKG